MTTKHTVVADHAIGNFRKDLRTVLFHAKIAQIMAFTLLRNQAMGRTLRGNPLVQIIKGQVQSLHYRLTLFEDRIAELQPKECVSSAILSNLTRDLDPDGHKVNNISNMTTMIAENKSDYTDKIDFVFSRYRQKEILKRYWIAAGGNAESFEVFHQEEQEYAVQ